MTMDPLARLRAFPSAPAPNDRPEEILGNVSLEEKKLHANILAYHVAHAHNSKVFANDAIQGLKLVEVNVREHPQNPGTGKMLEAETVCEIRVEDGMLNVHGSLAGGCAAHFLDICTFSSLFALGVAQGNDASGVSQSMNLVWHAPALRETELRIVSTSLTMGGRLSASRAEAYDKKNGRLLISVVHTMAGLRASPRTKQSDAKL